VPGEKVYSGILVQTVGRLHDAGSGDSRLSAQHEIAESVLLLEVAKERSWHFATDKQADSEPLIRYEGSLLDDGIEENGSAKREAASDGDQLLSNRVATQEIASADGRVFMEGRQMMKVRNLRRWSSK
jgi:hypothetical protein